jgi:hypothetical protein
VNQPVLHILNIVLATGSAQVPILVEIALHIAIHASRHGKQPDVKLPTFVKEGSFTILLDNKRPFFAVDHIVLHDLLNLGELAAHSDSTATIGVFTRFDNP